MKEIATSSQFSSVDNKTSDKLSYLTSQLQAGFHKLITISVTPPFIANSLSHALIYLSYWETLTNRTTLLVYINRLDKSEAVCMAGVDNWKMCKL